MNRPPLEVADLVRAAGRAFLERSRRWITWQHLKVLRAIARCRTAALGGHLDECTDCGYRPAISYNSCRDRHCPKCQANARHRWLEARRQELLPTRYVHVVFTLPHELAPLALQNKKLLYHLLLHTSAETLLEVARDPKHLGAEIGFLSILHSWGQTLQPHPHIHCVVPGGGLSPDHQRWLSTPVNFFLPVVILSRVFRGKFVAGLRRAFRAKQLAFCGECLPLVNEQTFAAFLDSLFQEDWVVYAKPPFGGPEHVLHYLARYTHRVAISNHRILAVNESQVIFRWKDYAHHNKQRTMPLACVEFLHRFLQHVLPKGFPRIRYFGWLANRRRNKLLPVCRDLLPPVAQQASAEPEPALWRCPRCHGPMAVLERLTAVQLLGTEGRHERILDSS